ncbi:MAG: alpha/beta hydrolase [Spirochaetota bacterium]
MNGFNLEKKKILTASGDIFYFINNSFSERPFVVLLHGLSSNHTTWDYPMEILHNNKYNVLAPDLRGHGFSDMSKIKKNYDLEVFSEDLRKVAKTEKIEEFFLVGYSFGGQIAIDYASKYPKQIKGLVLIGVNHTNYLEYKGLNFLAPIFSGTLNLLAFLFLWQKRKKYHYYRHGKASGYWNSVWDGLRTMPLSVNFWMLANIFKVNLEKSIKKIKAPTVIVRGEKDLFITRVEIKDLAKKVANSKIIFSRNPDHFVGTNAQDETIEIILNFLNNEQI